MNTLRNLLVSLIAATLVAAVTPGAWADGGPGLQFGSAPDAGAPAAAGDHRKLLEVCDSRLEVCERDAVGLPYLVMAYLALWLILIGYLVIVRKGQQALALELAEVRARMADLEPTDP